VLIGLRPISPLARSIYPGGRAPRTPTAPVAVGGSSAGSCWWTGFRLLVIRRTIAPGIGPGGFCAAARPRLLISLRLISPEARSIYPGGRAPRTPTTRAWLLTSGLGCSSASG
jgi:hypothetical protein